MLVTMSGAILENFRHNARVVHSMLHESGLPSFVDESATTVRVERGVVLATSIDGLVSKAVHPLVDRLIELASSPRLPELKVVDAASHSRAAYRPLLVYAWLQSYRLLYETLPTHEFSRWEEAIRPWADLLESDLGSTAWPVQTLPASAGDRWAEMAWDALALFVAGKAFVRDVWIDLAADTFGRLVRGQQPSGAFLAATPSDQPETWWYHELQILHAASSYAVMAEDRTVAAAVARAGAFHQNETQPDHATTQPWGLFALIWNNQTKPLADQLLHSVKLQQPGAIDGVSLMLLADCLYCLRLFGA